MPDLQHIHVPQSPVRDERLEDARLAVAGQQGREPAFSDPQDDAGLVRGRIEHASAWREDVDREATNPKRPPGQSLDDVGTAAHAASFVDRGRRRVKRTRGKHDQPNLDEPLKRTQASVVVGMEVGDYHRIQVAHAGPRECGAHRSGGRPCVHEQVMAAVSHENRVPLPHVEHFDL